MVRRGFYWTSVEKEKGVYDFSDYNVQMGHAKKLGLTVVGCLFGNNKLYEDDGLGGIQTEPGRKGFANFAAALAEHYKDHDVLWEVWNEPNVRSFWRKNGQTLGMQAWRIKLVDEDGAPPGTGRSVLRCLAAMVSAGCLGLGYLWCLVDRDGRYWHDYLSHTQLVLLPRRRKEKPSKKKQAAG